MHPNCVTTTVAYPVGVRTKVPEEDAIMTLEERLEMGEIVRFTPCPFALPETDERTFLLSQRLKSSIHKNISFQPATGRIAGFLWQSSIQSARLAQLMDHFARSATNWLATLLPRYARAWKPDRASFSPQEEATRKLRFLARNDLLHVDAFPSRPTQGYRLLRLYVNLHPTDPHVWVTSDSMAKLLETYGRELGLPDVIRENWAARFSQGIFSVFQPGSQERTAYDRFMLKLHDFLKTNEKFQERAPRHFCHFPSGTAWLAFTDGFSHAELRGRDALEHSYFIAPRTLAVPDKAPAVLLERTCAAKPAARAA